MKTKTLAAQIQESAQVNRDIQLASGERTNRTWPLCLTCFKEVNGCEMVNINRTSCEIRATCAHSSDPSAPLMEDYYKVYFPIPLDGDPFKDERNNWAVKRALHDFSPFNPEHLLDTSRRKT